MPDVKDKEQAFNEAHYLPWVCVFICSDGHWHCSGWSVTWSIRALTFLLMVFMYLGFQRKYKGMLLSIWCWGTIEWF